MTVHFDRPTHRPPVEEQCEAFVRPLNPAGNGYYFTGREPHRCCRRARVIREGRAVCQQHGNLERKIEFVEAA